MTVFERARSDECASDLVLDRLIAGDVAGAEEATVRMHLGGCVECRARLGALEAERAAYRAAPPRLQAPAPVRASRSRWSWAVEAAGAVAVAAALILFLRPGDTTRTKGGLKLGFYVKRGDEVWRGGAGEHLRPGDRLRFTAALPKRRYVAVLSLDAARRASVYFPVGAEAAAVEPAAEALMPMATVLDDELGPERLFGLFCASGVELEPVRAELARTGELVAPAGCDVDVLSVDKRAGP